MKQENDIRAWKVVMQTEGVRDILDFFTHDADVGEWYDRHEIADEVGRPWQTVDRNIEILVEMGLVEQHPKRTDTFRRPDSDEIESVYENVRELDDSLMEVIA